jgi:acetyl-CoA synthetase
MTQPFGGPVVWRPTPEIIDRSQLTRFMSAHRIPDLAALHRRSIDQPEWFWNAVLEDLDVRFTTPYTKVMDTSAGLPWTRWCVGGEMNIFTNCVEKRVGTPLEHRVAIRWAAENADTRTLTYGELAREVNRAANGLRRAGVGRGDVIGVCLPMLPELAVAFFAIAKIGAIVMPLFSGYGPDAIATRLADAGASMLITADATQRKGRMIPMKAVADEAVSGLPSIRRVVVVRRGDVQAAMKPGRDVWWDSLVREESVEAETAPTSADEPFMLIYTSGTTGRPKGAVHTHCGFPVKAAQDMQHGFDLGPEDTLFWITDMGWMMGPWELLGATLIGATILMYDGAVDYPSPGRLWQLVAEHRVSVLGVTPTLIRMMMHADAESLDRSDVSSLRILGSTGEPWNPDPWRWLFEKVGKSRLPIINYSGGTEISGGIVSGNVLTPMKPCAFAGPLPGIAADVVDESGRPVRGRVGELAIRAPWIGMTRGFWRDPERYLQTYWTRIPGMWLHGDWAMIEDDRPEMWYILGRSDDTLKIAGKRVGPAEIESVLVADPRVKEAAAVGVPDPVKGEKLVCFCVLDASTQPAPSLETDLCEHVRRSMGSALTPQTIRFVRELPKTRNGKIMRRVIRALYTRADPGDLSALDDASRLALEDFSP